MSLGLVHIYTGEGKGKTTAALGLLLRAAGRGIPAVLVQFLKGGASGEIAALERFPGVTVLRGKGGTAFASAMGGEERAAALELHNQNLGRAIHLARTGACGLLVLDEVMATLKCGLVEEKALRELLERPPEGVELVLTGRSAPEWMLERADYITEMKKLRHPYDRGVAAREGIEY